MHRPATAILLYMSPHGRSGSAPRVPRSRSSNFKYCCSVVFISLYAYMHVMYLLDTYGLSRDADATIQRTAASHRP